MATYDGTFMRAGLFKITVLILVGSSFFTSSKAEATTFKAYCGQVAEYKMRKKRNRADTLQVRFITGATGYWIEAGVEPLIVDRQIKLIAISANPEDEETDLSLLLTSVLPKLEIAKSDKSHFCMIFPLNSLAMSDLRVEYGLTDHEAIGNFFARF